MEVLEKYQKTLLDLATNELTAHSAMLFAVLSGLFSLMRVIVAKENGFSFIGKIVFFIILWGIITASSYVTGRLLFWAKLLSVTINMDQLEEKKERAKESFTNFVRTIASQAVENIDGLVRIHPSRLLFTPAFDYQYLLKHLIISFFCTIFVGHSLCLGFNSIFLCQS